MNYGHRERREPTTPNDGIGFVGPQLLCFEFSHGCFLIAISTIQHLIIPFPSCRLRIQLILTVRKAEQDQCEEQDPTCSESPSWFTCYFGHHSCILLGFAKAPPLFDLPCEEWPWRVNVEIWSIGQCCRNAEPRSLVDCLIQGHDWVVPVAGLREVLSLEIL